MVERVIGQPEIMDSSLDTSYLVHSVFEEDPAGLSALQYNGYARELRTIQEDIRKFLGMGDDTPAQSIAYCLDYNASLGCKFEDHWVRWADAVLECERVQQMKDLEAANDNSGW